MKKINLTNQVYRIIISIIVGMLLILFPKTFQNSIIYVLGGVITLLGIIKLITYFLNNKEGMNTGVPISALSYTILGVIMILKAGFFVGIIMLSLGFILIIAGLSQIMMYLNLRKGVNLNISMFISPALILIGGIMVIYNPFGVTHTLIMFFGYVVVFYGLSELISIYIIKKRTKKLE